MTDPQLNNHAGTIGLKKLLKLLSARDLAILTSLDEHRFLTTSHLVARHFFDHATEHAGVRACLRVMARLYERKLITRLERAVGGHHGGSGAHVWTLAAAGDRLVRSLQPASHRRRRSFEPTLLFLVHTLAIADVRVELEQLARTGRFQLEEVGTEPGNWRTFTDRTGAAHIVKPDLFVRLTTGDEEAAYFLEIDRGTESLPVLLAQCRLYQQYYDSGAEADLFPQVVWLIPDRHRAERLNEAIQQEPRLADELFIVIGPHQLASWLASGIDDPHSVMQADIGNTEAVQT